MILESVCFHSWYNIWLFIATEFCCVTLLLPVVLLQLLIIIITCLICLCSHECRHQMTLRKLLDHLKLVASYQEVNKMTCQNLAVCFGPVLLSQRQEASCHTNRVFIDSEELASALHFKKHIEVLHYLLQLWPGESFFSYSKNITTGQTALKNI